MRRSYLLTVTFSLFLILAFSCSVSAQNDDKYLIQARKLLDKKKYDEALEAYQKSFQTNPNWKAAYGIGSDFLRKGNYNDAVVYFRKAREIKEDEPMIWYSLGYSFGRMNENEEAVKTLQKAVELKPNYIDAWYNLGSVLFKLERYKEAIEAYQTTVKLNPKDAEAHAFLGVAYSNLNDFGSAVESFQKAVKLAPNNASYRQNLAGLQTKLKEQNQKAP
jgi:tetratricopeptide (TPR) repeat protein